MKELCCFKAPVQAMAQQGEGIKSSGEEIRIVHKAECLEKSGEMPSVLKTQKIRELSFEL